MHKGALLKSCSTTIHAFSWLKVYDFRVDSGQALSELILIRDTEEAVAVLLAEQVDCRFLLMDEWWPLRSEILSEQRLHVDA